METKIKSIIIIIGAAIAAYFKDLATPMFLLFLCNAIDYVTGIIAAPKRGQVVTSYRGLEGISKKICMWLLVAVGVVIDEMCKTGAAEYFNINIKADFFFAAICCLWIMINEIISICENLRDIGVPLPAFLLPFLQKAKGRIENTGVEMTGAETESEEQFDKLPFDGTEEETYVPPDKTE